MIFIHGANHAGFNEVWTRHRNVVAFPAPGPELNTQSKDVRLEYTDPATQTVRAYPEGGMPIVDHTGLLRPDVQRDVGIAHITAWILYSLASRSGSDETSREALAYREMALGRAPIHSVASVIMNHQYQGRQCTFINNYEEDDNKTTTSLGQIGMDSDRGTNSALPVFQWPLQRYNEAWWNEHPIKTANPSTNLEQIGFALSGLRGDAPGDTRLVSLRWNGTQKRSYVVRLPEMDETALGHLGRHDALVFRAAEVYDSFRLDSFNREENQPLLFSVSLVLRDGSESGSVVVTLPAPPEVIVQWGGWSSITKTIMDTVTLPLAGFARPGGRIPQAADIERVVLRFDQTPTAWMFLDDMQFCSL
ncbi:MAG: hypothetical protein MUF54_01935 [Polyangiaceae bacterium]|nr:hypothetical protein [Polyangiaceae bacterium]